MTQSPSLADANALYMRPVDANLSALSTALADVRASLIEGHCVRLRTLLGSVTEPLDDEALADDLPDILGAIGQVLANEPGAEKRLRLRAPAHGAARFAQGFSFGDLIAEYPVLRAGVTHALRGALQRELLPIEADAIHGMIDHVAAQTSVAYARQRENTLQLEVNATARFLTGLSHDLRNELGAVDLSLRLVEQTVGTLDRGTVDAPIERALTAISLSRATMHGTLEAMTRILQAERNQTMPTIRGRIVSLYSTLTAISKSATGQWRGNSGQDLASDQGLSAPPDRNIRVDCPREATLETDPELLSTILLNFAGNALQYAGDELIDLRAVQLPDGWRIEVIDRGPGIAVELRDQLFEEFQRGGRIGGRGVGLGLSIAHRAATLLSGRLDVDTNEHGGSTFSVTLPTQLPAIPS